MLHNDAPLRVGMSACTGIDGTGPYSGDLDELTTFPAALSQADVQALAAGVTPQPPPVADLSVVAQAPDHIRLGDQFVYDLTIANAGPDDAAGRSPDGHAAGRRHGRGYSGPECAFSGQPVPGQASRLDCSWNTLAAGTQRAHLRRRPRRSARRAREHGEADRRERRSGRDERRLGGDDAGHAAARTRCRRGLGLRRPGAAGRRGPVHRARLPVGRRRGCRRPCATASRSKATGLSSRGVASSPTSASATCRPISPE